MGISAYLKLSPLFRLSEDGSREECDVECECEEPKQSGAMILSNPFIT